MDIRGSACWMTGAILRPDQYSMLVLRAFSILYFVLVLLASAPAVMAEPLLDSPQFSAVKADPSNPETTYQFAREAMRRGDAISAIGALEYLLQLNPGLDNIRLDLGELYLAGRNPAAAEIYIEQALQAKDIPSIQKLRAQQLLANAKRQQLQHRWSGTVFAGIRYDSNANSSTDLDQIRIGNRLTTNNEKEEEDFSVILSGSATYQYDFQNQAADYLELNAYASAKRHFDLQNEDTISTSANIGPWITLDPTQKFGTTIRPFLSGGIVFLDDDYYLGYGGGGVDIKKTLNNSWRTVVTLSGDWEEYENTAQSGAAENRTGPRYVANASIDHILAPNQSVYVGAKAIYKDADKSFETYKGIGGYAGYSLRYFVPNWYIEMPWSSSINGSIDYNEYNDSDPLLASLKTRQDLSFRVGLGTSVPVSKLVVLRTEVSYTDRDSEFDIYTYDNFSATVGLGVRF